MQHGCTLFQYVLGKEDRVEICGPRDDPPPARSAPRGLQMPAKPREALRRVPGQWLVDRRPPEDDEVEEVARFEGARGVERRGAICRGAPGKQKTTLEMSTY